MTRVSPAAARPAVQVWLLIVAAMLFVMVLVGGATRLTESGLSIVEWRPVTGTLPPLSENDWQAEFEKYRGIPQYQSRNRGMSLQQFKSIYWWEWTHRALGRLIGAVFLFPFLWFLWSGAIEPGLRTRLWLIFGLGALQGAVGWWMVASGLAERVSVSQYRLAFHLTLACAIYAAVVRTLQGLSSLRGGRADEAVRGRRFRSLITASSARNDETGLAPARVRGEAFALLLIIFLQIYVGALVAGLHAGLTYNTWPLIDGGLVPSAERLLLLTPAWRNLFENELTVQFAHRMVAYLLWATAIAHTVGIARRHYHGAAFSGALMLATAVTIQAVLGILTLLHQVPMGFALAHQGMAMVVLTVAVLHVARCRRPQPARSLWCDPSPLRSGK
jgi:cytochrome c oxidase assembly protein subunit 15